MSLTLITITGTFTEPDGSPASGTITATLSEPIENGSASVDPSPVVGVLGQAGQLLATDLDAFKLYANDEVGTDPMGSLYTFVVELSNTPVRSFQASIPHTATLGTIDFSALEN